MGSYKSNIWKMYIIELLQGLFFAAAVLIPFYTEWGHINFSHILLLQSIFMFSIFILEVPTGAIADYFGRKTSIVLGSIVVAVATIVYASYPSFYIFALGEFLFGMGIALMSGADEALIYDSLKKLHMEKESKKVFGRWNSFHLVGLTIAPVIGSIIFINFGIRAPIFLVCVPFFIAAIVGLTLKEPRTTKKQESKRYIDVLVRGFKFFIEHKELKILALDFILIATISYYMIWTYQLMLQKAGVITIYFGVVHSLLVLAQIAIINNYGILEKWIGSKAGFLAATSLIMGAGFIAAGLTNNLIVLLFSIIICGGFGLGRQPAFSSYMNKYIPSRERATVLSSMSMFRRIALVVCNLFMGMAILWSLNYTLILLGITAIIFTMFSKTKEHMLID